MIKKSSKKQLRKHNAAEQDMKILVLGNKFKKISLDFKIKWKTEEFKNYNEFINSLGPNYHNYIRDLKDIVSQCGLPWNFRELLEHYLFFGNMEIFDNLKPSRAQVFLNVDFSKGKAEIEHGIRTFLGGKARDIEGVGEEYNKLLEKIKGKNKQKEKYRLHIETDPIIIKMREEEKMTFGQISNYLLENKIAVMSEQHVGTRYRRSKK
ncbi:MAG: hypothetical protein PHU42_01275 [Patescibacteria group bacterium]|nr:hypothetical protein [Patescibacteria group bacterium]